MMRNIIELFELHIIVTLASTLIDLQFTKSRELENFRCNLWPNHQLACFPVFVVCFEGVLEVFPPRTTILAKKELIYAGPFGLAAWLAGVIFVDRKNRIKAQEAMNYAAQVMHKDNVSN